MTCRALRWIGMLVATSILCGCQKSSDIDDRPWALPTYQFNDIMNGDYVAVTGTLIGNDVGYKQNTFSIRCVKGESVCRVADVEEIGKDQLGEINVTDWDVVTWTDTTIVIQDVGADDQTKCAQNSITLNRVGKTVSYDSIAKNSDKEWCKKLHRPDDHHWSIGAPKQPWER